MTPTSALKRLETNTEDYCRDRIDYATFDTRQRAAWDEIRAAGLTDAVLALWRKRTGRARIPASRPVGQSSTDDRVV